MRVNDSCETKTRRVRDRQPLHSTPTAPIQRIAGSPGPCRHTPLPSLVEKALLAQTKSWWRFMWLVSWEADILDLLDFFVEQERY